MHIRQSVRHVVNDQFRPTLCILESVRHVVNDQLRRTLCILDKVSVTELMTSSDPHYVY